MPPSTIQIIFSDVCNFFPVQRIDKMRFLFSIFIYVSGRNVNSQSTPLKFFSTRPCGLLFIYFLNKNEKKSPSFHKLSNRNINSTVIKWLRSGLQISSLFTLSLFYGLLYVLISREIGERQSRTEYCQPNTFYFNSHHDLQRISSENLPLT